MLGWSSGRTRFLRVRGHFLEQWFWMAEGFAPPGDIWNIFWLSQWGGVVYTWHLESRGPGKLLNILQCTGRPHNQRLLCPKMSTVMRLRTCPKGMSSWEDLAGRPAAHANLSPDTFSLDKTPIQCQVLGSVPETVQLETPCHQQVPRGSH